MSTVTLFDRIYGCMLGGAVGDAMGFPTEGLSYTAIRRKYGKVSAPMIRPNGEHWDPPVTASLYTDDTVMKHMVCEAIFESDGRPTIEAIANVWRRTITNIEQWVWWLNTRTVAQKLRWNPWIELREMGRDSIACNDAAMIIGPVGLINGGDPFRAAMEAWDLSSLWNTSYSRECAAAMSACHAEAIKPSATVASIVETARTFSPRMKPYIDKAMAVVARAKDADDFTEQYYATCLEFPNEAFWNEARKQDPDWCFGADPLEVCTEALAFLALSKGDARTAILGAINFGRDCDTIAGIAAAFCGALHGPASIPAEWGATVIKANPQVDIKAYSEKLYRLLLKNLDAIAAGVGAMRE